MRRFRSLVLPLVLLVPSAALAQKVTHIDTVGGSPVALDGSADPTEDVRFKNDLNDRMTVAVTLAGRGPFRFLVDAGADRTAISSDVVRRIGLVMDGTANLHSITGAGIVQTASVRDLRLSQRSAPAPGQRSVPTIAAPVLEAVNMGADGVLGTDTLHAQRIMFDFKASKLTITPSRRGQQMDEAGTIVVEASRREGRLIMTDAVADRQKLTVVIDTGSEICVGNSALRAALSRKGVLRNLGPVTLTSVTGEQIVGDHTILRSLQLGDVTLKDLAIVFTDAHTFKQMRLEDRPTLLMGMNAMRAFDKVSIDFANKTMRVLMPDTGSIDSVRLASR